MVKKLLHIHNIIRRKTYFNNFWYICIKWWYVCFFFVADWFTSCHLRRLNPFQLKKGPVFYQRINIAFFRLDVSWRVRLGVVSGYHQLLLLFTVPAGALLCAGPQKGTGAAEVRNRDHLELWSTTVMVSWCGDQSCDRICLLHDPLTFLVNVLCRWIGERMLLQLHGKTKPFSQQENVPQSSLFSF